jgi:hypothetical protein
VQGIAADVASGGSSVIYGPDALLVPNLVPDVGLFSVLGLGANFSWL